MTDLFKASKFFLPLLKTIQVVVSIHFCDGDSGNVSASTSASLYRRSVPGIGELCWRFDARGR